MYKEVVCAIWCLHHNRKVHSTWPVSIRCCSCLENRYCRRHISPSLTSFVRLFDSAEGVYSTASASEAGICLHPTPSLSTARHGLKRLHHGSARVAQASRRVWMDDFRR